MVRPLEAVVFLFKQKQKYENEKKSANVRMQFYNLENSLKPLKPLQLTTFNQFIFISDIENEHAKIKEKRCFFVHWSQI